MSGPASTQTPRQTASPVSARPRAAGGWRGVLSPPCRRPPIASARLVARAGTGPRPGLRRAVPGDVVALAVRFSDLLFDDVVRAIGSGVAALPLEGIREHRERRARG